MGAAKRCHRKESTTILPAASILHRYVSLAHWLQPFVGFGISMLKKGCASKTTRVSCAAFALVAFFRDTRTSHETELRQRDPLCTVAHPPRRGCARMHEAKRSPARRTQPVPAHLITVGLPGRSATPISRGNANALGSQVPGAFCFQRSQRKRMQRESSAKPAYGNCFRPEASGRAMLRARGRGAAATGACAPRGDASTRAARGWVCDA